MKLAWRTCESCDDGEAAAVLVVVVVERRQVVTRLGARVARVLGSFPIVKGLCLFCVWLAVCISRICAN